MPWLGLALGKAEVMESAQAGGRPTCGHWSLHCLFSWPSIVENRVEGWPLGELQCSFLEEVMLT